MKKFLKELQKLEIMFKFLKELQIVKSQIVEPSQSSKETLVNEVSGFDPLSFIKNIFKIN